MGTYFQDLKVSKYAPKSLIEWQTTKESYLRVVFSIKVIQVTEDQSKVTFKLHLDNDSLLFQYTLGLISRVFLRQQLQHSLIHLKWSYPNKNL